MHNISSVDVDRKHDASSEQHVPNTREKHENSTDDHSYYSLKHLREIRRGERDEDSTLSRRVKRFYKDQDELIDAYDRVHNQVMGNEEENNAYKKQQRIANILTKVSFVANMVCQSSSCNQYTLNNSFL